MDNERVAHELVRIARMLASESQTPLTDEFNGRKRRADSGDVPAYFNLYEYFEPENGSWREMDRYDIREAMNLMSDSMYEHVWGKMVSLMKQALKRDAAKYKALGLVLK